MRFRTDHAVMADSALATYFADGTGAGLTLLAGLLRGSGFDTVFNGAGE